MVIFFPSWFENTFIVHFMYMIITMLPYNTQFIFSAKCVIMNYFKIQS